MIFFTSDTHYWHKNVIEIYKRPFQDLEAMHEAMINRWNAKIRPEDEVWHLGDFFFCGTQKSVEILKRLNGRKNLILGNHDYGNNALKSKLEWGTEHFFESVQHYKNLKVQLDYEDENEEKQQYVQSIVLSHFPILSWDRMAHGSWHLHGHCHGSIDNTWNATGLRLDCGVDCHNFEPISVAEVSNKLALRTIVPVDQHKAPQN